LLPIGRLLLALFHSGTGYPRGDLGAP
jgi:hypothetical protein